MHDHAEYENRKYEQIKSLNQELTEQGLEIWKWETQHEQNKQEWAELKRELAEEDREENEE